MLQDNTKKGARKTECWESLENFAKSPNLQTCNHCAAIKKGKEKNRKHMMRSQYILSFLPSLFSLLPPFFSHKLRQIHMGCELWKGFTNKAVSLWLSSSGDETAYTIIKISLKSAFNLMDWFSWQYSEHNKFSFLT